MLKISNWLLSWSENTGTGLSQWQGFLGRKDRHSCLGGGSAGPDGWRDIVWRSEWASLFSRGGFPADCQGKVACLVKDGVRMWLWMCPPEAEPLSWLHLLLFWWNYLDKSKLRREGWFCLGVGELGLAVACHTAPALSGRRLWTQATAQHISSRYIRQCSLTVPMGLLTSIILTKKIPYRHAHPTCQVTLDSGKVTGNTSAFQDSDVWRG